MGGGDVRVIASGFRVELLLTLFVLDEWVCSCLQQRSHGSSVHVARCHVQWGVTCKQATTGLEHKATGPT